MKSTEIKSLISEKFNIAKEDIRIRQDYGWIHIYIRESLKDRYGFKDFREERDFLLKIESVIIQNADVCTYVADDGYGTDRDCILSGFDSFEFL